MLSIIIPTLQKNINALTNLLNTLEEDKCVGEIILIDNSLKGYNGNFSKLKIITPKENLYVNPSWNLGVEKAKFDKIGLLNDDIAISSDFCTQISMLISKEIGLIGMDENFIEIVSEIKNNPKSSPLKLNATKYRGFAYGTAMFFDKSSYFEIPNEIKIVYGDDWLFLQNKKHKKQNYVISNQKVYHLGSISSGLKTFNPVCKNDAKIFKKLTIKWYNRIFSFDEYFDSYKFRLFGLTLKIKKQRKNNE